jgi:tetratricopeptide (TPR) repeat protein
LDDVTRELGVDEVVQGRVSVDAERFKVDLWLTTAGGDNVWEASREGSLARPLQTMEWLKSALLQHLEVASTTVPLSQIRSPSVEAYQTYLQANDSYSKWDIEEHLEQALDLFRQATELDLDFAAAHALLARALVTQFYQTYDPALMAEATQEMKTASNLAPDLPEVLIAIGFVEEARGNSVEAEMTFKRAIELAPGNDQAYRIMASFYSDLGRHEEAQVAYQKALTLRPGLWINHYDYGRYLHHYGDEPARSRQHLEKAVEYHPSGVGPTMALGNTYLSEGKLDEAATLYRKALENRKSPWAHYNLGVAYYYRGEYELAHRSFEAALERLRTRPSFEVAAGDALRQLGQLDEAQAFYTRALVTYRRLLADQPNNDENRIALATLLATLDRCDEARKELDDVLTRNPESADFASEGAYASMMCGDRDEAIRLALVAIQGGDCLYARFDPALESVREAPEVRQALADAGLPLQ